MDWGIDETMTRLIEAKQIPEAIVVAIWNTPKRLSEYMPQKPFERVKEADLPDMFKSARRQPLGDAYLRYLVRELKPAIDARYRTLPGRESHQHPRLSMGGLIALYAVCEYPEVFGGAACLSRRGRRPAVQRRATCSRPCPIPERTESISITATKPRKKATKRCKQQVDTQLRNAGYAAGTNWITKDFPARSIRNGVEEARA